ncbi:nef protein [Simian immunodeficiency virus]|uniref:Protein Nef n=1 Tax=Simian immunodeficiency virus TaxID=11723 RepID=Q8JAG4_SIV|nr:nef protein [Simian immunodeficiency virus]
MGSKNSKQQQQESSTALLSSRGTGQRPYFTLVDEYGENFWLSPDASDKGRRYYLTEEPKPKRGSLEEYEPSCPVRPRVPLRDPTYKVMVDLSHFLKEKGGLEGMFYCEDRHQKLEQYAYLEWGLVPGWLSFTPGPGTRYPTIPGFCICLRPVATTEDSEPGDDEYLLTHPAYQGRSEDQHKEFLVFSFCSKLAIKSGIQLDQLQQEERKMRLTANRFL